MSLPAPSTIHCPKCGGTAHGPIYKRFGVTEWLEYRCTCGFTQTRPTADAPDPPQETP